MSSGGSGLAPHILHVLPQGEALAFINAFGNALRHTLVTADGGLPAGLQQSAYLKPASNFPSLEGLPTPGRMQKLARAMTPFDLVLTYGYEALDVAMAHTLFKDAMDLPALVHHETEPDRRGGLKRSWYRRIALGKSAGLVVPGEELEEAALVDWQQPMGRVKKIAPGIDTKAFARRPKKDGFRLIKHDGEFWVGAWPEEGAEEALLSLVRAFVHLDPKWQLIVLGEGARTRSIEAEIDRLQINDRVYFPGAVRDPAKVLGLFDIFVEPGATGGFPERMVQAMAASCPIIAPRGGEMEYVLAPQSSEWLFDPGNDTMLGANLLGLAKEKEARSAVGEANRARAVKEFDRTKAIATYRRLYSSAMKREF
ncbi:glycosyltransferase family 4 protein [Qipengyuania sphaerica]|uniref:glycosyltransferase family 4 protein n=1 Tax=Qipengyuania sphaerica TaxID=2867243 RepID=UPI001C87A0D1|nr:glycosyltransferase family 4 protein [Qipengyuania sphaerica]MBX7540963.1 glycosyltransferase family 4 protein [Qipengyuania sphaerica]